jgi:hypothetical protein
MRMLDRGGWCGFFLLCPRPPLAAPARACVRAAPFFLVRPAYSPGPRAYTERTPSLDNDNACKKKNRPFLECCSALIDGGEAGAAVLSALDCGGGGGDRTSATRARPLFFGLRPSSRPLAHTHTQTPLDHHPFSLSRHTRTLSSPSRQAAAIEETRLVQTSESPPFRALSVSSPFPRTRAPTTHTDQREPTP